MSWYGSVHAVSRRQALYAGFWWTAYLSALLVSLSIWFDLQPRDFELGKTLFSTGCGMAIGVVFYLRGVFVIRRWIKTGRPRIKGMKHPTEMSG